MNKQLGGVLGSSYLNTLYTIIHLVWLSFLFVHCFCLCYGRWAEQNVDPALFSRELMSNASSMVDDPEVAY